ncbi:carboxypeptidase regulatory-like domain-containing protein, partial [Pyxidicoccus sp. 3LG]
TGVRVVVEPIDQVPGWPRPPGGGEALSTTSDEGAFELRLDPAVYRVDFLPAETRPRISRVVTVLPGEDPTEQELEPFSLQKGRTLTGTVTDGDRALPYASIRFYRVVTLEGRPTTVLLAQTVSDHLGRYTALIPVR